MKKIPGVMGKVVFKPTFCMRDWDKVEVRGEVTVYKAGRTPETFSAEFKNGKIDYDPRGDLSFSDIENLNIMIRTYVDCFREAKEFSFITKE